MIYYKHDDPNFTLTAYIEGEKEPIAWIDESLLGWKIHDGINIHTYPSFTAVSSELEERFG